MAEQLCQVCNAQPKKYKCPTCSIPYCSLTCFKQHKLIHENQPASQSTHAQHSTQLIVELPEPPPPAPVPRYLKQKVDFTVLASDPRFKELLKTHPSLLPALQRVYAATIEPDPEDDAQNASGSRGRGGRGRGRGYGRGDWKRGRGRGRGGRFTGTDVKPKWTEKKGDADALRLLKKFRGESSSEADKVAMAEFVRFVEEKLEGGRDEDQGEKMDTD